MTFGGFCLGVGVGRNRAPTPKVGVWPLKRQAQWKSTLLYFRGWQLGMGVWTADSCPKANSPPHESQWARAFPGEERGLPAETAQSAQTVILKWVTGGLTGVTLITYG